MSSAASEVVKHNDSGNKINVNVKRKLNGSNVSDVTKTLCENALSLSVLSFLHYLQNVSQPLYEFKNPLCFSNDTVPVVSLSSLSLVAYVLCETGKLDRL